MMLNARTLLASLVMLLLVGCQGGQVESNVPLKITSAAVTVQPEAATTKSVLPELNREFRQSYTRLHELERRNCGTLAVASFKKLSLVVDGKTKDEGIGIPRIYFDLRYCAHIPFTIALKLMPDLDGPVTDALSKDLAAYRSLLLQARGDAGSEVFTLEQRIRQQKLIDRTIAFIDMVSVDTIVRSTDLKKYLDAARPIAMENSRDAAIAQIRATHEVIVKWRGSLSDEQWQQLTVVVVGTKQPRNQNVTTQYFAALFQDPRQTVAGPGESVRLIYSEMPVKGAAGVEWDAEAKLAATVRLDYKLSELFFGDPWRMSIDVMADGAQEFLREFDFAPLSQRDLQLLRQ